MKSYITSKEDYRLSVEKEYLANIEVWRVVLTREIIGQGTGTTELYLTNVELETLVAALSA